MGGIINPVSIVFYDYLLIVTLILIFCLIFDVANDSPPLQPRSVGPGAKPRRWAPLTRDTRKGIQQV